MAGPVWTNIPTTLLDQFGLQKQADDWANDQLSKVADDWDDQQKLNAPPSSDSLTNPLGTGNAPVAPPPTQAAGENAGSVSQPAEQDSLPQPVPPAASGPSVADVATTPGLLSQAGTPAARQSQFGLGLSSADAMAFCGPTAAIAFAKTYGRNPTVDEAKQLAQSVGWNPNQGMAGVASEQALLTKMGVQTKLEQGINWDHVAQDSNNGNPVIIDTPGHYFYVTGARQGANGLEFNVGTSGTDLRAGATWMTANQMASTMGAPRAALYADHPLAGGPSVAERTPLSDIGDTVGSFAGKVADKAGQVVQAVQSAAQPAAETPSTSDAYGRPFEQPAGPDIRDVAHAVSQSPLAPSNIISGAMSQAGQVVNQAISDIRSAPIPGVQNVNPSVRASPPFAMPAENTPLGAAMRTVPIAGMEFGASGEGIIQDAMAALKAYPSETAQPIMQWAAKALSSGQKASDVGGVIKRWIAENPVKQPDLAAPEMTRLEPEVAASVGEQPTPAAQPSSDVVQGLTNMAQEKGVPLKDDWQAQLSNLKQSDAYQNAPRSEQLNMVSDAQQQFQAEQPPSVQYDQNGNVVHSPEVNDIQQARQQVNAAQNMPVTVSPDTLPTGGRNGPWNPVWGDTMSSARGTTGPPLPEQPLPAKAGITPETVQAAHERIDKLTDVGQPANDEAHAQLDSLIQSGAAPDEIARFFAGLGNQKVSPTSILRSVRTGSLAGGLSTEGKVALNPIIQTAMRAPVGALKAIVRGQPGDIGIGLQGGLAGLAEGAADGLQTIRYGTNYRAALTGGAQGGYGFSPGIDVLGQNVAQRALGTAALGLVRTHGAIADVSAGIGRGASAALGATPEAATEAGQQWAMRSDNYGTIGKMVSNAFEGIRQTNPAFDVVGQILMPFYRVGYNALTQGVERSPVGLAGTALDVARGAVGQGPYARGAVNTVVTPLGDRLANNMFGVGLAGLGFALASQGVITGEHPDKGNPQWSVKVAGQWIPLRTLGPAQEALAQSAALYEAARDGHGDVSQMAEQTAQAYAAHVYDESWLRSVADTLGMAGDIKDLGSSYAPTAAAAQRNLSYQVGALGKSFVPQSALIGQVAKAAGTPDLAGTLLRSSGVSTGAGRGNTSGRPTRPKR